MSERIMLQVESRESAGSGVARKLRRQGRIPATLYGHGEPELISIDQHLFRQLIKPSNYGSTVVHLQQGSRDAGTAIVKDVQADPLRGQILNVDLQRVSADEMVSVSVPVTLHGEPEALRAGGVLEQTLYALNIRCRTDAIPTQIEYDISVLGIGDVVHAAQLALPPGGELLDRSDEVVAVILSPTIPATEERVAVEPEVAGPDLVGEKQKEDFPPEK